MNAKGLAGANLHGHHAKNASIEGKVAGDDITSYRAFWRYYLSEHAKPATRAWHYLGTTLALLSLIALVASGKLWLIAVILVAGYGPAWIGHFFVEANRPATFRYPFWSLVSDIRLYASWLSGRLGAALAKAGLLLLVLLLLAQPATADRLAEIMARGQLIVGVSDTTPPFSFRPPGAAAVRGYDIDLVSRIAERLGVALTTVSIENGDRIAMVKAGRVDLIASAMTRSPARAREVDFSIATFVSAHEIVVAQKSGIAAVAKLRSIAVVRSATVDAALQRRVPAIAILHVADYAAAFAAMKAGEVDGFLADGNVVRSLVQHDAAFLILPDYRDPRISALAMGKDEARLKDFVDRTLLNLEASGEAARIFAAWFGPESSSPAIRDFRFAPD